MKKHHRAIYTQEQRDEVVRLFKTENDNRTSVIAERLGVHFGWVETVLTKYINTLKIG